MQHSLRGACAWGAAAVCGAALAQACLATPALALSDQTQSQELPAYIAESIPGDAVLVSTEYARLATGELVSVATGEAVDETSVAGTTQEPADPLSISGGGRFAQLSVAEAREQLQEGGSAQLLANLPNSGYGAYWGSDNGVAAFFMGDGTRFVTQAQGIIDVSEHNGAIDWARAKADGVQGAIIRIGFGTSRLDYQAERNITECKRLGIPFGIYIYSYAENNDLTGAEEGAATVSWLKQLGVSPQDLSLPVYYDLEEWTWSGHTPPTSSETYTTITKDWFAKLEAAGYTNLGVYSYTSYLNGPLNSSYIHGKTNWVAQYSRKLTYNDFGSNNWRGWQYTSSGSVAGISGNVDLNAFGNATWVDGGGGTTTEHDGTELAKLGTQVTDIEEGDYFLKSSLGEVFVDIDNASKDNAAAALVWSPNDANNQLFHIKPVGNGQYTIQSVNSGKLLDVNNNGYTNGTGIIQFDANGGANQRWTFWRTSTGDLIIASVSAGSHNKVLDLTGASSKLGTKLTLWAASGNANQRFQLLQKVGLSTSGVSTITSATGHALGVRADSVASGAVLELQARSSSAGQRFRVSYLGNGRYALTSRLSGLALALDDGAAADSMSLVQSADASSDAQRWYFVKKGSSLMMMNYETNDALTISGVTTGSGVVGSQVGGIAGSQGWTVASEADDKVVVRLDLGGGSGVGSLTLTPGSVPTRPADPKRPGYTFDGWYTAKSGGSAYGFSSAVSSDVTVYAHWTATTGWFVEDDGAEHWYENGKAVTEAGREVYDAKTDGWYLLAQGGTKVTTRVAYIPAQDKWVFYDASGKMAHGEAYLSYDADHTGWYYFDPVTGKMAHGTTLIPAGSGTKWVYYDIVTGQMAHGLTYLSYDTEHTGWYYFDPVTGEMAHGTVWVPERGRWIYFDSVTGKA